MSIIETKPKSYLISLIKKVMADEFNKSVRKKITKVYHVNQQSSIKRVVDKVKDAFGLFRLDGVAHYRMNSQKEVVPIMFTPRYRDMDCITIHQPFQECWYSSEFVEYGDILRMNSDFYYTYEGDAWYSNKKTKKTGGFVEFIFKTHSKFNHPAKIRITFTPKFITALCDEEATLDKVTAKDIKTYDIKYGYTPNRNSDLWSSWSSNFILHSGFSYATIVKDIGYKIAKSYFLNNDYVDYDTFNNSPERALAKIQSLGL
jgi:hypothetical protein